MAQQSISSRASNGEAGLRHARLRWVSTGGPFANVNRNDARAALKVLYDLLARDRGFVLDSTVDILNSLTEVRTRLQAHSTEVVLTGVGDYLQLENSGLIAPMLTEARGEHGGARYSYLLLVNRAAGSATIASLRGKRILVFSRGGEATGIAWLDVLLATEKLGRAASFFASVSVLDKAQACILPLFFGKVDACVVDEVSLNLAKEMNPQLGQLRELARSRAMIEIVLGVPVEPNPFKNDLIDAMLALHENARGRQLLMVFKIERLVRIQPGDLDSARELWRDYHRLIGASPHRIAGSAPLSAENSQADRGKAGY